MRRMYNRYLIYNELKDMDYDWFVIMRSDLFFVNYFTDINKIKEDALNIYRKCNWKGYNNNLIVFHKNNIEKILTYIKTFLDGSFLNFALRTKQKNVNEERFFKYNMDIKNIKPNYINNVWYTSADSIKGFTTWAKIKIANNGDIYKYKEEYDDAMTRHINKAKPINQKPKNIKLNNILLHKKLLHLQMFKKLKSFNRLKLL